MELTMDIIYPQHAILTSSDNQQFASKSECTHKFMKIDLHRLSSFDKFQLVVSTHCGYRKKLR